MKITKKQLVKIIREERSAILSKHEISPEQAEAYLRSKADAYRRQGVTGKSMEMLLMDDFMDDLGHQHSPEDYEGFIRELVLGESKMRITKRQLRQIIKEEKAKLQEISAGEYGRGAYADDKASARLIDELERFYYHTMSSAMDDGHDELDAEDIAGEVLIDLIGRALDGVGHVHSQHSLKGGA